MASAAITSLAWGLRLGVLLVRLQHLFLSPLVALAVPGPLLLDQNLLVMMALASLGLVGMMVNRQALATAASLFLLGLLILGKAAGSVLKTSPPDTAVLVVEFTLVVFFLEASLVVSTFNREYSRLRGKEDELSSTLRTGLHGWLRGQLAGQAKLGLVTLGLSIGLLPLAGFTSIPSNQIIVSSTLALLAIVVLMFLVTHRREPAEE